MERSAKRFSGKRAIVTGSSGSIGSTIARALAEEGCALGLIDLRSSSEVASEIERLGSRALSFAADISNADALTAAMRGRRRPRRPRHPRQCPGHHLVRIGRKARASRVGPRAGDQSQGRLSRVPGGHCAATRARRRANHRGSILGKNGGNARPWMDPAEQNASANVAYGVSKAGVHTLKFYLARELARFAITVNCVSPGRSHRR